MPKYPIDPECLSLLRCPTSVNQIIQNHWNEFSQLHRAECPHCWLYGLANAQPNDDYEILGTEIVYEPDGRFKVRYYSEENPGETQMTQPKLGTDPKTTTPPVFSILKFITPEAKAWFSARPAIEVPEEAVTAIQAIVTAGHPFSPLDIAKLACSFQFRQDAEALEAVLAWRNGPEGPDVLFEEGAAMMKKVGAALGAAHV